MVEFAVLWLKNPAGAKRHVTFSCNGIHIQWIHSNSYINHSKPICMYFSPNIQHSETPLPAKPYLQGTRPLRSQLLQRTLINTNSYSRNLHSTHMCTHAHTGTIHARFARRTNEVLREVHSRYCTSTVSENVVTRQHNLISCDLPSANKQVRRDDKKHQSGLFATL
jgi:hypothetical protein